MPWIYPSDLYQYLNWVCDPEKSAKNCRFFSGRGKKNPVSLENVAVFIIIVIFIITPTKKKKKD